MLLCNVCSESELHLMETSLQLFALKTSLQLASHFPGGARIWKYKKTMFSFLSAYYVVGAFCIIQLPYGCVVCDTSMMVLLWNFVDCVHFLGCSLWRNILFQDWDNVLFELWIIKLGDFMTFFLQHNDDFSYPCDWFVSLFLFLNREETLHL